MKKLVVLPNFGMYPIHPEDMSTGQVLVVTHEHWLDSYLARLVHFCAVKKSFFCTKNELSVYFAVSSNGQPFSSRSCDARSKELEEIYGLIYLSGEGIFLTHELICEVMELSGKINLKNIEFDEIPNKTEIEKNNSERFRDIKALVTRAKEEDSYGPFNPDEFVHASELCHFVTKTKEGLFVTPRLLTYLFKHYPSLDCVSVSLPEEVIA